MQIGIEFGAVIQYGDQSAVAASELIGRQAAISHIVTVMSADRIVTLTGPGGIGKTVLASEVARRLQPTIDRPRCLPRSCSSPAVLSGGSDGSAIIFVFEICLACSCGAAWVSSQPFGAKRGGL